MAKCRKRPVVIEAERWDGESEINGMINRGDKPTAVGTGGGFYEVPAGCGLIPTLEGPHLVSPGDWIITGVKGERYPCKPDIFELTYEPIETEGARE